MEFESKEFDLRLQQLNSHAEHLRTIHFTLLITVFVVLVGTFMAVQPDYTKALEQLNRIQDALRIPDSQLQTKDKSGWDADWLIRRFHISQQERLFPGLVLNRLDIENFLPHINPTNTYHFLGNSFSVRQTPSDFIVERLYANIPHGPRFYVAEVQKRIPRASRVIAFFYPCIHFEDIATSKTECRMSEKVDYSLAFLNEEAVRDYEILRARPRNLSEFRKFWARLRALRIQLPSVADNLNRGNALVLRRVEGASPSKRIAEIAFCGSIGITRDKAISFPKDAAPIGLALSTYYSDDQGTDLEHRLAKGVQSCDLGQAGNIDGETIHWKAGYYGYVDPFRSFQSSFAGKDGKSWFMFQIPLAGVSWQSVDGPRLLDPRLAPVSSLDFERAFPDLSKIATRLTDLNWDDLKTVLEDQSKKQSETVSIFGVSVPLALLFFFGTLAILAIQAYMIAHVLDFVSLAHRYPLVFQMQNFPWIGVTEGSFYRLMTIATVSIVPFAVILNAAVATFSASEDFYHASVTILAVLAEFFVAISLGLSIHKLGGLPRPAKS